MSYEKSKWSNFHYGIDSFFIRYCICSNFHAWGSNAEQLPCAQRCYVLHLHLVSTISSNMDCIRQWYPGCGAFRADRIGPGSPPGNPHEARPKDGGARQETGRGSSGEHAGGFRCGEAGPFGFLHLGGEWSENVRAVSRCLTVNFAPIFVQCLAEVSRRQHRGKPNSLIKFGKFWQFYCKT